MKIFFSAGEASGDLLGADLLRALAARVPDFDARGLGGPGMQAAGLESYRDLTDQGIMGILPVIRHLPDLFRLVRDIGRRFDEDPPDAFVPIDYPGLNLVLSKMARKRGIPVIFYVSPQLWAWGPWRVGRLRRRVDRLLAILPFEEEFFGVRGIPTRYVGHPLVDRLTDRSFDDDVVAAVRGESDGDDRRVLGLLPGSRVHEVQELLPTMLRVAARLVAERPEVRVVLPAPPESSRRGQAIRTVISELERDGAIPAGSHAPIGDHPHAVMKNADACLVASGTATAELAWFGTPMAILYRVNRFSKWIAPRILSVPHIGMANILAGERIVPEFFYADPPEDDIRTTIESLLFDTTRRETMKCALAKVRETLGEPGASDRAAEEILRTIDEHRSK